MWLWMMLACGAPELAPADSGAAHVDTDRPGDTDPPGDTGADDTAPPGDTGSDDTALPGDTDDTAPPCVPETCNGVDDDCDGRVDNGVAGCPLRLYLAPDGDDARDGLTEATAVETLSRAHALVAALDPGRDVELRIAPGRYHGQRVTWTFTMPDFRITLMPLHDDKVRPVFDGCTASGACPGGTWFTLAHADGEPTNLHFEYVRVERYQTAISLNGDRNAEDRSNGHNRIYGCYFDRIGNVFAPSLDPSTAAVRLVNSDHNEIANSHFVDVVNTTSGGLIHAIYAAHMSDDNAVERNRFVTSTGDPVRIRDFSNRNVVRDNTFVNVGVNAGYTDWYCDHDVRDDCTKATPECPSWDNQFRDNTLDGTYACGALGTWELFQDDVTTGCSPPTASSRRVRTSGNTRLAVPCSGL